ncbi:hypothetical protein KKF34_08960 [Myxococcota bacterium]|nr:hypothetical protein [Myxococcota bacterium]MBU1379823.1 hypothetical protein [Myxococcota bacterium]MBU1496991.1 hypothetical protein [Myxococcota bacterium]
MKFKKVLSTSDFINIGRRFACEDIAREVQDILARWQKDVAVLGEYGYGEESLNKFRALRNEHVALMDRRSQGVSEKKLSIVAKNEIIEEAWVWVDKCSALLGSLARMDEVVGTHLREALPDGDTDLESSVAALGELLKNNAGNFGPTAKVEERLSEVGVIKEKLSEIYTETARTKSVTILDTADLDLLDGKLYIIMKDVNEAGRMAIRAGNITGIGNAYRFSYIKNGKQKPTPANPQLPIE